jgi:hypothetical protein
MKKLELTALVEKLGQRYSEVLGINVDSGQDDEVFKWFLAAVLFGAPIAESSVLKTYRSFEKNGVLFSKRIVDTGWDNLVKILDEGGYTRYDFKTAEKLLLIMRNLNKEYNGSLSNLYHSSSDSADLERRLKELGKGIGDVTVSIFLRELRGIWDKADPKPTPLVIQAARKLGIARSENPEKALNELKIFWKQKSVKGKSFINFETALLRWAKENRKNLTEF